MDVAGWVIGPQTNKKWKSEACAKWANIDFISFDRNRSIVSKTDWFCVAVAFRDKLKSSLNKWTDRWKEDKTIFYENLWFIQWSPVAAFLLTIMECSDIRYTLHRFMTWMQWFYVIVLNAKTARNLIEMSNQNWICHENRWSVRARHQPSNCIHLQQGAAAKRSYVSSYLVPKTQ